jgi:hypothetical protein
MFCTARRQLTAFLNITLGVIVNYVITFRSCMVAACTHLLHVYA